MKIIGTIFWILFPVFGIIYLSKFQISFKPFSIKAENWENGLGVLFMGIALILFGVHNRREEKKRIYEEFNDDIELIGELQEKAQKNIDESKSILETNVKLRDELNQKLSDLSKSN